MGSLPGFPPLHAAETPEGPSVENRWMKLRLIPRTPEQIAAFYEARGFPGRAVEVLAQSCFITAIIRNRSDDVVWLELDRWRFESPAGTIERLDRAYWKARWQQLNVPQASRSTFGWTLLPEVRDLRPAEPAGGNVTLPQTDSTFGLEARFYTGADKSGEEIVVRFENLQCPQRGGAP